MHNHSWRQSILALTISGLLLTAAHAEKTSTSNDSQMTKPAIVERDPFVNQIGDHYVSARPTTSTNISERPSNETAKVNFADPLSTTLPSEDPGIEIDTSGIQVTGIVGLGQNRQAIMTDGTSTRIIQVGQKLSDFRVALIDEDSVVLSQAGQRFRIPLASEY